MRGPPPASLRDNAASKVERSVLVRKISGVLIMAVSLVCAAEVQAALPKKGVTLIGTIKSSPFPMKVNIGVSPKGTISHLTYLCGTGRPPTTVYNLPVDATGHFSYTSKLKDWKIAGHFATPTTAFVSLNSIACGGSKGSTTLHLK
jgi:hypothetical protein